MDETAGRLRRTRLIEVAKKTGFITDETKEFLLRGIGEIRDDPDEAIAKAVADGTLVLVERPRAAYCGIDGQSELIGMHIPHFGTTFSCYA